MGKDRRRKRNRAEGSSAVVEDRSQKNGGDDGVENGNVPVAVNPGPAVDSSSYNKQRKRHKDTKELQTLGSVSGVATADSTSPSTPKKRKKKKKKKRRESPSDGNDNKARDEGPPLEGSMVGDRMVLIDRSNGVVFSATERNDDGTRKQIGGLKEDGRIEIEDDEETIAGKLWNCLVFESSLMTHVSKPATAYCSLAIARSNIMPDCVIFVG